MDARPRANGAPRQRILVADDHESLRLLCRINLEFEGMAVTEAADGVEALRLARGERFDLILLDLTMPGLDGWDVAEQLLADVEANETPIVFVTGRASAEERERAFDLGAVGYVVKPFNPVELGPALKRLIRRVARGEREQVRAEVAAAARASAY